MSSSWSMLRHSTQASIMEPPITQENEEEWCLKKWVQQRGVGEGQAPVKVTWDDRQEFSGLGPFSLHLSFIFMFNSFKKIYRLCLVAGLAQRAGYKMRVPSEHTVQLGTRMVMIPSYSVRCWNLTSSARVQTDVPEDPTLKPRQEGGEGRVN